MLLLYIYINSLLSLLACANVEKTIFIAPSAISLPAIDQPLDDRALQCLSPSNGMLRTKLNASFPTDVEDSGTDSWYLLKNLNPGQRYEVRICWLATQPTAFTLSTYTLPEVLDNRSVLSAISLYSSSRLSASPLQATVVPIGEGSNADSAPGADSILFLRISAAADYFSLDQALMENVPPVMADIILDPFLGNVFPKSLVPTACWVGVVSCLAIVVARRIAREFARLISSVAIHDSHDGKKDR
ncbi:hypothetical protein BDW62DRAFT_120151 [Aspergillus aurantiobrunneus]